MSLTDTATPLAESLRKAADLIDAMGLNPLGVTWSGTNSLGIHADTIESFCDLGAQLVRLDGTVTDSRTLKSGVVVVTYRMPSGLCVDLFGPLDEDAA